MEALVNDSTLPQDIIASDEQIRAQMQQMQQMQQAQMAPLQADAASKNARAMKDMSQVDPAQLEALAAQMTGGGA